MLTLHCGSVFYVTVLRRLTTKEAMGASTAAKMTCVMEDMFYHQTWLLPRGE